MEAEGCHRRRPAEGIEVEGERGRQKGWGGVAQVGSLSPCVSLSPTPLRECVWCEEEEEEEEVGKEQSPGDEEVECNFPKRRVEHRMKSSNVS